MNILFVPIPSDQIIQELEVLGPSGPRLLACGPSGLLDFVLRALRALRPCYPRDGAMIG